MYKEDILAEYCLYITYSLEPVYLLILYLIIYCIPDLLHICLILSKLKYFVSSYFIFHDYYDKIII